MQNTPQHLKKRGFPAGVFIMLLFLLFLLSVLISAGYFYQNGRSRSDETARDTKKYAVAMTEALGNIAELCYASKDFSRLKNLLREKMSENTALEAFFILIDGKIVAHSNRETEERLQGNVANDEFAYNLDLLLRPIHSGGSEVLFTDYNIINQRMPFDKYRRALLKRFIYPHMGAVGWLATRAVYHRGKAVGTVNLILSKQRIFSNLESLGRESVILLAALAACSLFISMIVSLVVYRRDRTRPERQPGLPETGMKPEPSREKIIEDAEAVTAPIGILKQSAPGAQRGVKDAIPLFK